MPESVSLIALFADIGPASDGIERLRAMGVADDQMNVISGIPFPGRILGRPSARTNVPQIGLLGAALGALLGLFLIYGIPYLYPLHVGGQPLYPVPMGFIATFEMTMLGLMAFSFLGLFVDSGFPSYTPKEYVPEIGNGKIAVLFACDRKDERRFADSLSKLGAESVTPAEGAATMSTSLSVILRRLALVAVAGAVAVVIMLIFSYDVIKIDWLSFMEIQPSFQPMEDPLPVPPLSIPVEGPAYISNLGPPANPVAADQSSIARGAELFNINCTACHGADGKGNGPVAPFLQNKKPVDLTGPIASSLSDGGIFMTISNGTQGGMPALNENLTVRERWDVVNYVRTLQQK